MSTGWGYVCISHDPELHESYLAHNTSGRDELATLWRQRDEIREDIIEGYALTSGNTTAAWFLLNHPRCELLLENEYGDRLDPVDLQSLPPKHCPSCTCEAK